MSQITINSGNLSKFNARTKKALLECLGAEVSLGQAQEVFARIIGVRNHHELQSILSNKSPFDPSKVVTDLISHLKQNISETITIYLSQYDKEICFEFQYMPGRPETNTPPEVFCLFDEHFTKISTETLKLKLKEHYNNVQMPEHLMQKISAFHEKGKSLIPTNKLNSVRGAFFDYIQEKGIEYKNTDMAVIYKNGAWAI